MGAPGTASSRHVIVAGYGPVGRAVSEGLRGSGVEVVVIEQNLATIERLQSLGRAVIHGDAREVAVLESAGIDRAVALVVAVPSEDVAIQICQVGHRIRPELFIAVRTNFLSKGMIATQAGADAVVVEELATAEEMRRIVCGHLLDQQS